MKQNLALTVSLLVTMPLLLQADERPAIPGELPFSYNKCMPSYRLVQNDLSISKNGKLAVSGGELAIKGNASGWAVWDIKTAKRVCKGQTRSFILHRVAISEDGKLVAVGGDESVPVDPAAAEPSFESVPSELKIYNAASGELLKSLSGHARCMCRVAFTPDGKHLVSLSAEHVLRVWTVPKGEPLVKVCFASRDPDRNEWKNLEDSPQDKAALNVVHEKGIDDVMGFAISPDGKTIAVPTGSSEVLILDTLTGKLLHTYKCEKIVRTGTVNYSPDGRLLVVGGSSKLEDKELPKGVLIAPDGWMEIWKVREKKLLVLLGKHDADVRCHAISPDNSQLVSGGLIDGVRIWDVSTGKIKYHIKDVFKKDGIKDSEPAVGAVAFLPDGKAFAVLHAQSAVRFWELATGKELAPTKLVK